MTVPPPLSEGLNPPLYSHANKTHFHMKGFALSLVLEVRVFGIRKWPIQCIEKGGKFEWFINIVPRTFHEKMGGAREPWGRECFRSTWEVQIVKEST